MSSWHEACTSLIDLGLHQVNQGSSAPQSHTCAINDAVGKAPKKVQPCQAIPKHLLLPNQAPAAQTAPLQAVDPPASQTWPWWHQEG